MATPPACHLGRAGKSLLGHKPSFANDSSRVPFLRRQARFALIQRSRSSSAPWTIYRPCVGQCVSLQLRSSIASTESRLLVKTARVCLLVIAAHAKALLGSRRPQHQGPNRRATTHAFLAPDAPAGCTGGLYGGWRKKDAKND